MKAQFEWNEEKMEHEAERAGTDRFFKEYQKKRVEPGDSVEQKTTHLWIKIQKPGTMLGIGLQFPNPDEIKKKKPTSKNREIWQERL